MIEENCLMLINTYEFDEASKAKLIKGVTVFRNLLTNIHDTVTHKIHFCI